MEKAIRPPLIYIDNVTLSYVQGSQVTFVLNGLNFSVKKGEFLSIVGPSGVGKSSLLRALIGIAEPADGKIHFDTSSDTSISIVFQDSRLLPWRRVEANVAFGLENEKLDPRDIQMRVRQALERVGIHGYQNRFPHQLSGGQKQRASLARALAVNPAILLMDEPFSALDIQTRHILQDDLVSLWMDLRKTIVFVTHDIDEAVYLSDRVLVLGKSAECTHSLSVSLDRPRRRNDPFLGVISEQIKSNIFEASIPS